MSKKAIKKQKDFFDTLSVFTKARLAHDAIDEIQLKELERVRNIVLRSLDDELDDMFITIDEFPKMSKVAIKNLMWEVLGNRIVTYTNKYFSKKIKKKAISKK